MKNPYGAYKKTAVDTASKEQLLIMLYEGAIKFLKQAIGAMEEKKFEEKGKLIIRAEEIINELMCVLDHDRGGNLSKDLEALYVFMLKTCSEANLENSVEKVKSVIKLLTTLLDGWKVAVNEVRKGIK